MLVVDDNEDAAIAMSHLLMSLGHVTRVAQDGPAALRLAAEFKPDVALLDIGLPVMDGYELARRIRQQPPPERIQLVAGTGYGQESDRSRSQGAGFNVHFGKPVEIEALERLINASPRSAH